MKNGSPNSEGRIFDFTRLGSSPTTEQLLQTLYGDPSQFCILTTPDQDAWGNGYDQAWSGELTYSEIIARRSFGPDEV